MPLGPYTIKTFVGKATVKDGVFTSDVESMQELANTLVEVWHLDGIEPAEADLDWTLAEFVAEHLFGDVISTRRPDPDTVPVATVDS